MWWSTLLYSQKLMNTYSYGCLSQVGSLTKEVRFYYLLCVYISKPGALVKVWVYFCPWLLLSERVLNQLVS